MKKLLITAFLFASTLAFADGYKDWFTPQKGWDKVEVPVKLLISTEYGSEVVDFPVNINLSLKGILEVIDISTVGLTESAKNAFEMSRVALANSLYSACQAQMNKLKIDNLGAALEGVFVATYGQYVDEAGNVISKSKSGVDTSKLRQQLIANKNAVVSGGQAAGGSEENPLTLVITQKPYDERQFEQHITDGKSLTSLKGWYGLPNTGVDTGDYTWAFSLTDFWFPITSGEGGKLSWGRWNGWNTGCFSAGEDVSGGVNDKELRLYGWTTANNCNESIQNLLTNKTSTADRRRHKILTRYDGEDETPPKIHWMKFDDAIIGGGSVEADGKSIEYTQDKDASEDDPKKLKLKGFDTAKPKKASDGAVLPFVDASNDNLRWAGIETFFADSVFRKSETTGKMLLNGTSEEGKVKVLAMTGTGGDDQTISALTFDNASIDGNPAVGGVVQLHGFDTAPSPYASGDVSFADVLTNTTTQITGMSVPVRVPSANGATVAYVPMGKITGIPAAAVDNKTVEVNETDPNNKFLQLHGAAGEDITLKEGDIYQIGSDGKGKFERLGVDAGIGAIPYKTDDGKGLGWLEGEDGKDRIPLIHTNSTPTSIAIGLSLDKANVEEVSTLNVAGFTDGGNCDVSLNKMLSDPHESDNRSTHQFMARYKKGDEAPSVHWVKMDDVINGGTAVRLVGTDGSEVIVGSASRTNTITFASAGDSNVKATVSGDDAGNITITIGVYYIQESNLTSGSGGGL